MFKKLLSTALVGIMVMAMGTTAFASEPTNTKQFAIVDKATLSDGFSRASWGEGTLHCSDPLFSDPEGYAVTSTYSGSAYKISAKISVKDSNQSTYSSETATETNSASAESGSIQSKTAKCTFSGTHKVQDTSSSGWQSASTSKTY